MERRRWLQLAAGAALARPAIVRAEPASTLRFIPQVDLALLDPHATPAYVTRNHGYLVFDTLFGQDGQFRISPQMLAGHSVAPDGREWRLTLRDGLLWHDLTPVLARDCVASIRRWAQRDSFGAALMDATDDLSAADDRTIRFRLRRPFPRLPDALGKSASSMAAMMPERLATTSATTPLSEMVGSGPFRFLARERVPGVRAVYERFDGYIPRQGGPPDWTAGPKIAHFERIVWTTIPDPATAFAAMATGEQDWWDYAALDLLPALRRTPRLRLQVLDPAGMVCMLRPNHLQPPFDDPAVRRVVLRAIDQARFMQAITSEPALTHVPLGVFCPGSPLATEAGLPAGPPDFAALRAELAGLGAGGARVVLLVPGDYATAQGLGAVAVETLERLGFIVETVTLDFASLLRRRTRQDSVGAGGWSLFVTSWAGTDWLTPATHTALRGTGLAGYPGWSTSPETERLRDAWFTAATLAEQQTIGVALQRQAMQDVPFLPLGQYVQPSALSRSLDGVLNGFATFWNVRRA